MKIKRLNSNAIIPTYGSKHSAGLDLYAVENISILDGDCAKIKTGISVEIPNGYFGAIFARSGLSTKQGLRPANCVGVVDSDYRGEVIVPLYNDSSETRTVCAGDRVAQMVIIPYAKVELEEVDELDNTERGTGGFGSTGE